MNAITDIPVRKPGGEETTLADHAGEVLLIVNTASKCGFTPQYAGLEALHRAYKDRGFSVLAFPCNQFGAQEPGDAAEIASFCSLTYDVTFPVYAKIDVNGPDAAPLFDALKRAAPGVLGSKGIKWNFTKFLVDRTGTKVERFAPTTSPDAIGPEIEKLL
ncbi:MAG: glutathione peroxidase [Sphingomonas sp.]|uniref:glutathione peroxidase n=1 Tax=unclassified Sphingomonas TaxID=196159 RepID=UPI002453B8B6|nr:MULTISPECIES: glutathione peroxidase [unclassified Sphingomonas]MBQ1499641.1 glutathione peroxidase [Sphingomonas sp.]MDH4743870.1 glutathione peroxidase [Sphingomonas sp. CBMAI 2297]